MTTKTSDERLIRRAMVVIVAVVCTIASSHVAADAPPAAAAGPSASGAFLAVSKGSGPGETSLAADARILCADEIVATLFLTVFNMTDLANTVITYEVSSSASNVVGFALTADGPFAPTIEIPVLLDGTGSGTSATFALKALDVGHTIVNACSDAPGLGCILNPREVAVVGISKVEFTVIDSPLDANPGPGGGQRIYPEKQSDGDAVDRRTVRVEALTTEARAGLAIHFRSVDVDDPSSDSRPVDANGPDGGDNFGVSAGLLDSVAYTDTAGVAEQTLSVSMQPGDNFRVAASCNASYLGGLQADGIHVVDAEGVALPTPQAEVTDLLTVWRKLHVEMDSMGLVTGNEVTGTIVEADPNRLDPTSDLKVQLTTPGEKLERHQFTNGQIVIAGLGNFKVVGNTATVVEAYGLLGAEAVGRTFVLVDDDDFNGNDGDTPDGDANENIFAPTLTYIQDGVDGICDGSAQNIYAVAYVCPVFDVGDNNDFVPFMQNVPNDPGEKIASYDFDAMLTEADASFWTVYLLGAYQGDILLDLDNERMGMAGSVDDYNGVGASIYLEAAADDVRNRGLIAPCSSAATVAHEIGHLFGATHADGGLMDTPCDKAVMALSDKTIAMVRKAAHP